MPFRRLRPSELRWDCPKLPGTMAGTGLGEIHYKRFVILDFHTRVHLKVSTAT